MTVTTLPRARHWSDAAACAQHPDLFIPENDGDPDYTTAKRICRACPVIEQCLTAAMAEEKGADRHVRAGVRGGLTPGERARKHRQEARAKAASQPPRKDPADTSDCGTQAAYQRHVKRHEVIDQACRDAHTEWQRERRAAAKSAGAAV
ncbi:WhiB family transcriptional regulator [Streptomyces flavidovirens]|uniref:WhiB family transcriptional regulator n=1 Tax=Streptomyces flavidovirens TaxID=67298 RepID=UPI0003F9AE97|nr:WhiB family transcriptional regulator [Streptomyces flavidovirens]